MRVKAKSSECSITAIPFIWLTLFFLIPTLIVYAFAFKPAEIYGGVGTGWTWETIKSLFSFGNLIIIYRSFLISFIATSFCLLLALPVGFAVARMKSKWKHLLLLLIVLPFWSSFIIRIYAWKVLLHPEGFLKQALVFLHIVKSNAILLYHPWTVILVMVYSYIPFAILPIYAAASKFDDHLFEAAMDLGMTRFKAFFKVFLPSIRRGIMAATLLVFIPALGAYIIPDIVGGTNAEMIGNKIVQKTFVERNIPLASALSAFLSLSILVPLVIAAVLQGRAGKSHSVKRGH